MAATADERPEKVAAQRVSSAKICVAMSIAAALVGVVYFALFNHDFSVNGLRYADEVERGIALFHPNHLLPNALFRGLYLMAQAMGFLSLRAIWLMQSISICCGIIAAVAIVRIASMRVGLTIAVMLGALYAFAFAAWNFAEEPDVYALPAAAVAISLAILLPREQLSWRAVGGLSVLAIFAVLTLQQYVFWYPALLALVARRDLGCSRRGKLVLLGIGVPLVCLIVYIVIGWQLGRLQTSADALGWFFGYAWDAQNGFGTFRPAPPFLARLLGALLGLGNMLFAYEIVLSSLAITLAAIASVLLLIIVVRAAVYLWRSAVLPRNEAMILLAWCIANLGFAVWWESRNIEFLFPLWLGAIALLALAAESIDKRLLALTVLLLGGINLGVAFWPQHDWPARYRVAAELARHEHLSSSDVLITEELNTVGYLHYFEHVDVRFLPGAVSAAMHASESVAQARLAVDQSLAQGARIFTTEIDEDGRLRHIAAWFAQLGRNGFDGRIAYDIEQFYQGYDVQTRPVPGARQILPNNLHR